MNSFENVVDSEQFQRLLAGKPVSEQFNREYPFYPLNSPGMPPPGHVFRLMAEALGDPQPTAATARSRAAGQPQEFGPALNYLYRRALYDPRFTMRVPLKSTYVDAPMLPGHKFHQVLAYQAGGPRRSSVMVIYKCPGRDEMAARSHLVSDAATVVQQAMLTAGVTDSQTWYVTPVVKWPIVNPQSHAIPKDHIKSNAILLEQELRLVQPDFILCLGSEAVKAILGDKQTIRDMLGRVADKYINLTLPGGEPVFKTARVMVAESPGAVALQPEKLDDFCATFSTFARLTRGIEVGQQETGLRHINIYKQRQLREIIDEIRNDTDPWRNLIAVDGEWDGAYPTDEGAYLRTIQFSTKHKEGFAVILRHQNGVPAFKPSIDAAITELKRLLLPDPAANWRPRVGGHFFRADLPWLVHAGIDARESYAPPAELSQMRSHGGFDTILQCHAVDETALYGLTEQTIKHTDAPAYDRLIRDAVTERCKQLGITKDQLEGYGFLPKWLLHPEPTDPEFGYNYAHLDVDCCRRICFKHMQEGGLLDSDSFGNSSWESYFVSHSASLGVLEMEMTGISVDFPRIDMLALLFIDVHNRLLTHLRSQIGWPTFNPSSAPHKVEFLFGTPFSPKIDPITNQRRAQRPEGALSLGFTPLKTTGKRSMTWDKVVMRRAEAVHTPAADKETLGILGYRNPLVMLLRDIVFVSQTLKGLLRTPFTNTNGEFQKNTAGFFVYDKGIASLANDDGKVRTRFRQTMETGRGSSSRPNLQAISSRREADYKRILGSWATDRVTGEGKAQGDYLSVLGAPCYSHPIRSVLKASPGYVLIEADYTGAELAVIAWLSGDAAMIEHVRRNILPENHPEYYDIHSNQAVKAFKLDCEPTKKGLVKAGFPQFRNAAKCVVEGTRLHTSQGMLLIEAVAAGLNDYEWQARPGAVQLASERQDLPLIGVYSGGIKPCLKVETEMGFSLTSTGAHQYRVIDADGSYGFRYAEDIAVGDWVAVRQAVGPFGGNTEFVTIPCEQLTSFKSINFPTAFNEDWAAFIGLFLAEGSNNPVSGHIQIGISEAYDPEFSAAVTQLLLRLFGDRVRSPQANAKGAVQHVITSVELSRWLCEFCGRGSHNLKMPEFVWSWPQHLLRIMLRWMFEGDGSAKRNGSSFGITYSTASNELAYGLQQLLAAFAVICKVSPESRAGYDGTYYAIAVRGNTSRDNFLEHIGFITQRKTAQCVASGAYKQDRDIIPHQIGRLTVLLPYVTGKTKEKCRECTRVSTRISLSPTRLRLILGAVEPGRLSEEATAAYNELNALLELRANFQLVREVTAVGDRRVYDCTTDSTHVVTYGGILTHQSVNFGIPYGRGAEAIARQCQEEGTDVTADQCQQIIDAYFMQYPLTLPFLDMCEERTQNPRWLAGSFGRYRRFTVTRNRSVESDQRRQGKNFPIQNCVADAVWVAIHNFSEEKKLVGSVPFRILMQIHDSLLFEVPIPHIREFVCDEVDSSGNVVRAGTLRKCMIEQVPVWPRSLDNKPITVGAPYNFGIDYKVQLNWGESMTEETATAAGVPVEFI